MKSKIFNDLKQNLFEGSNPSLLKKKEYYDFFDFNKFDFLFKGSRCCYAIWKVLGRGRGKMV